MTLPPNLLYITYIEKENACLKIWGQTDRNMPIAVEKTLAQVTPVFEQGHHIPTIDAVYNGLPVCAKFKDGMYYRARVTNTSLIHQGLLEVHFIDYGNRELLPFLHTRLMSDAALKPIMSIPPQAKEFILALVTHPGGNTWDENTLAIINAEIRYVEMHYTIIAQIGPYNLIRLISANNDDLALNFISRRLVNSISLHTQEMILHSYLSRIQNVLTSPPPPQPPPQEIQQSQPSPTLLNFKAITLEPNSEHAVYVSYVSDGPLQFSVQLKKMEDTLAKLMNELDKMQLQPLDETVIPGTVCVAKCMEDGYFCRAVVTSMVDSQYKVFFVDFGNTEVVPLDNLYQIPFKYVIPKVMAMRFALAGLEKSNVTLEMKCAFKDFVCNRPLRMRVAPAPRRSALPTCELWDEHGISALDVLKKAAMLSYPDPIVLNRGLSQDVRVSFVYSCNRFFVQLKSKESDLNGLMGELQMCYANQPVLDVQLIKEGLPCCALYDGDQQWYRAQVLQITANGIKVRYIDYGNEELIPSQNLRRLQSEHVTSLKPQALECCLNGYQNMEQDRERDNLLEELILEKDFAMKVFDTQENNRVLVELFDSERYNVSSLLLEKIALTRSHASPLLIQDGLKFEHRKRSSLEEGNQRGKKPTNAKDESWRQTRSPRSGNGGDFNNSHESRPNRPHSFKDNDRMRGGGFREGDSGGRSEQNNFRENRKDFNSYRSDGGGFREKRERNDFSSARNNDRSPQQRERFSSFNSNDSSGSGRPKKFDNKRDGSEKSWSDGSESSWKKGPRNARNDFKPKFGGGGSKRFDSRPPPRGGKTSPKFNGGGGDTWNIDAVTELPDLAPNDAVYDVLQLNGSRKNVMISWFHNPSHFYCQLQDMNEQIKTMMDDIQNTYITAKPTTGIIGAPVIAIFPEDNVLYRARILDNHLNRCRVFYVDFGNTATVDKVYAIQRKFMELPAQAINCCLRGVAPLEREWGAEDSFGEFFGKEVYECAFLAFENEQYIVDLTSDNQNIAEALITNALAKPDITTPNTSLSSSSQIEINMLKGQQLRVTLTTINNLNDFEIHVIPDLTLKCTAHNLTKATETDENILRDQLNHSVIVYVDDVMMENNRLVVTLYDTQGYKLTILQPDDGAFESVDPLCPLPIFYSTLYGWVSHVTSQQTIFVQPNGYADTLAQLLEQLYQFYNESILEVPIIPVMGFTYAVKSTLDGNWYRAKATSVDEDKATFFYLDYGNCETVAITEVRELDAQFLELHTLAIEVFLSNATESLLEQEITLKIHYNEGWIGEIIEQPQPTTEQQQQQQLQPSDNPNHQNGIAVILTHLDTPSEFYLQLADAAATVEKLQNDLQTAIPTLVDLENPTAGVLCAAPYSLDQLWYRAQVLDADADITTVRFVDYGNTDVLENGVTSVKTLTSELLMVEQYARRCSLNVRPIEEEWSPNALQRFEELTADGGLFAEIINQDEKTTYIELYTRNGLNITETLINEHHAIKLLDSTAESNTSNTGFVSHLNSPTEFWIQLESSVADLEWIADQLANAAAATYPELEDLTPGSLCAAIYPDDDNWYRARILSNTVAGLEVLFIDYGNSCTCTCMRALPEELALMPAMAQKCMLQKPREFGEQWTPQACERFKEIAADGVTIFNVKKLTTGETAVVDLLLNGQSVSYMLLPKTVDCYVTKFETLESFHIRKHDDVEELNTVCRLEGLVGVQWNAESNRIFADLNRNGKTLFQVEFVTSDLVRLYIDGRDIRTDLGGTKTPINSTTTTPKKYIDDNSSKTNNTTDDISDLVVEIVENVSDSKERETDVKNILTDIVSDATGETEVKQNVDKILSEIVGGGGVVARKEAENEIREVLSEVVDSDEKIAVENQVNEIVANAKTEIDTESEIKNVLSDLVEDSVTKSEIAHENSQEDSETEKEQSLDSEIKEVLNEKLEESLRNNAETQETLEAVANTLSDIIEKAAASGDAKKTNSRKSSRSSSRCSGRFDVEDRVVPGAVSRPRTPEPV